jgi:hypothetical protein
MKLYVLLIIGFALSVSGCGNKEQATPEQEAEAPATVPAAEPMAAEDPAAEETSYYFDGIVKHMHSHADQVDLIDIAIDDGDLEAAKLPARWLWRHDRMEDVPADWLPYLVSMREAARGVENATDLDTARAASARITEQCQACHTAAGVINENE